MHLSLAHRLSPAARPQTVGGLRRIRLHQRVAKSIQDLRPEDYELLAYHYSEAGDEERALEFTIKAADRAKLSYANQEAIRFYTEALAVVPKDSPQRFELLANRETVYGTLADREPQGDDLKEMLSLAELLADDHLLVRALIDYANYSFQVDRLDQQRIYAERAFELAQNLSDSLLVAKAYMELGNIFDFKGDVSRVFELKSRAKEILQKLELSDQSARVRVDLASILGVLGKPKAALKEAQEALRISRELRHSYWEARSLFAIAFSYFRLSKFDQARQHLQQANQLFRKIEHRQYEFYSYLALSGFERRLGNLDKNLEYLRNSLDIVWHIGEPTALSAGLQKYAIYRYLYSGDLEDGINVLTEQIAVAKTPESPGLENMARVAL